MKLTNLEPDLLPIDKLPLLKNNVEIIERNEKIVELLNKRKRIINSEIDSIESAYEKNEREIILLKTDGELIKYHSDLFKRKSYVEDLKGKIIDVLKEMDKEWSNIIEKAELIKEKNEEVKKRLDSFDMNKMDDNWELAIDFYLNLKGIIYPEKNKDKKGKLQRV